MIENFSEQKLPNEPDTDFRPEVITASLIEQGYSPEQIHIIREGYARRGFTKEIEGVELRYSLYSLMDVLHIRINREGMYDMLPQGLFHQPPQSKRFNRDKEEVLEEMTLHRKEEFFARKFFQSFEIIADETVSEAFLLDIRLHKRISRPDFVNLFVPYWPLLKRLPPDRANLFLYIIPILHQIRTRREETEKSLSVILDAPIKIENITLAVKTSEPTYTSMLGKCRLGIDFVPDGPFYDGESDLKLIIGPISSRRMIRFIRGGKDYELLEILCDMFLPVGAFVVKEFKTQPEDSVFILSDENTTTYLGINSYI
ncbi:MAG: type VI secretion system baseplate subunit TssG [Candidatus Azobacteroides sp.]|nr:type VI secretion system baseplate subunit TssG [Candidatus Azobacteroides sp.]